MMDNYHSEQTLNPLEKNREEILPMIKDTAGWVFLATKESSDVLKIEQTLEMKDRLIKEKGVYKRKTLNELGSDVYTLDDETSTSGCLPHGTVCYLKE